MPQQEQCFCMKVSLMSEEKNRTKIAITKEGKDLFRLIFDPEENGKYDIKIACLGKPYNINVYQHFAYRPTRIDPTETQDKEISYHHGQGDWPVLIHLKNTKSEEPGDKYETMLNVGLNAPSVQQMFPQPLFKIEIPQSLIETSLPFHPKKGTAEINIQGGNVIEFYLVRSSFNSEDFYERYNPLFLVYSSLSIEYFCTNSIDTGFEKIEALQRIFDQEQTVATLFKNNKMSLQTNFFHHDYADALKECRITLFQNDMAEDILLNTLLTRIQGGLGFASKLKIQMSAHPSRLHFQTATQQCIDAGLLTPLEKDILFHKGLLAEARLYQAMDAFENESKREKDALEKEAALFMKALASLKEDLSKNKEIGKTYYYTDDDHWILLSYPFDSLDISLLFSAHQKRTNCMLISRNITGPRFDENARKEEQEFDANGHPITHLKELDLRDITWQHTILGYDDFWDIDLLRGLYNDYFAGEPFAQEPKVKVTRGYLPNEGYEKDGVYQKLKAAGYALSPFVFQWVSPNDIRRAMSNQSFLLQRVLNKIEKRMRELKANGV